MSRNIDEMVMRCEVCAHFRRQQRKEPLMFTPLPDYPWQQVGSDLFEYGDKNYLVVVDYFSRFPEVRVLPNLRANTVITACREIFACHGIPERFISDNGPQYVNREFRSFACQYAWV